MAHISRKILGEQYFKDEACPTGEHYKIFFSSFLNFTEDEVYPPDENGNPLKICAKKSNRLALNIKGDIQLDKKANSAIISGGVTDNNQSTGLIISAHPNNNGTDYQKGAYINLKSANDINEPQRGCMYLVFGDETSDDPPANARISFQLRNKNKPRKELFRLDSQIARAPNGLKVGLEHGGGKLALENHLVVVSDNEKPFSGGQIFTNADYLGQTYGIKISAAFCGSNSKNATLKIGEVELERPDDFTKEYLHLHSSKVGVRTNKQLESIFAEYPTSLFIAANKDNGGLNQPQSLLDFLPTYLSSESIISLIREKGYGTAWMGDRPFSAITNEVDFNVGLFQYPLPIVNTIIQYTYLDIYLSTDTEKKRCMRLEGSGDLTVEKVNGAGSDYAEFFESSNGEKISIGTTVVLERDKIRPAMINEKPFGVISNNPTFCGNAPIEWPNKFVRDASGSIIYEEIKDGFKVVKNAKLNSKYDPSLPYVPRQFRGEWNCVALLGQVHILRGQPIADNWIRMKEVSEQIELWFIR